MQYTHQTHITTRTCPYSYNGKNLAEMRLAKLRPVARSLDIEPDADWPKNEVLRRVIDKLHAINAPYELAELAPDEVAPAPKSEQPITHTKLFGIF